MESQNSIGSADVNWQGAHSGATAGAPGLTGANSGVASLDSPLVQQTKSEIRTLAAEIAELAHSDIAPDEFYNGFLPRLCVAMGATASAVWRCKSDSLELTASHMLPEALLNSGGEEGLASEAHELVLQCAIAEGQPVLVPPKSVTVDADRPTNPLTDSLIIVPVRIEENIAFLVEIVQRPSGGPAAQRGYLRFVAQMADLMADYYRRRQLREFAQQKERLALVESSLLRVASQGDFSKRASAASTALADLLEAEMCFLFVGKRKPKLVCVSGVSVLDPRSEVGLLARQILVRQLATSENRREEWFNATDRRSASESSPEASGGLGQKGTQTPLEMQTPSEMQASIDRLCELTHCRSIFTTPLGEHSATYALLLFPREYVPASKQQELGSEPAFEPAEICQALGALVVGPISENTSWKSWLPFAKTAVGNSNTLRTVQTWIVRFALLAIAVVIALFPLPQQISATATLMPVEKIPYYAPIGGIVELISVSDAEVVEKGQPLVKLRSDELSRQIDTLNGQLEFAEQKQLELEEVLSRGEGLSGPEKYQLEGDLEELGIEQNSTRQQLEILEEQEKQLNIAALEAGVISSWDLRNRLLNRPVNAGDPLLTTFQPSGPWKLQLAIPDYRVGIVSRKLSEAQSGTPARSGIPVRFSLSSHPDLLQDAVLVSLSSQVNQQSSATSANTSRIVYGEAVLDAKQLPLTKDGAIARATIDCGKVPAAWLMVRDAYWAVSSRVQMIW